MLIIVAFIGHTGNDWVGSCGLNLSCVQPVPRGLGVFVPLEQPPTRAEIVLDNIFINGRFVTRP